jgi:hypothetical protein
MSTNRAVTQLPGVDGVEQMLARNIAITRSRKDKVELFSALL